jgi:polyhydroxybutyrate depolymerase
MLVPLIMSMLAPDTIAVTVGDLERTARVAVPADTAEKMPVVFVFHGHGGTAVAAQKSFKMEHHWPEAMVIYPQGLPTPTQRDPEGKRDGWNARSVTDNRDIAFFDALLEWARKTHSINEQRVYVTGHSNGGGFTYLLATQRGDKLAAVAPSSAGPSQRAKEFPKIPVLHLGGEKDIIVPFASQERMVNALRDRFGLMEVEPKIEGLTKTYRKDGMPEIVFFAHPGGHSLPVAAYPLIVEFFRRH